MSHLTANPASSNANQEGTTDEYPSYTRSNAAGTLSSAQGMLLAELVNSLYPEWSTADVYEAVGSAVAQGHGTAAETVLATLIAAANPSNGTPGVLVFPGAHWATARDQVSN